MDRGILLFAPVAIVMLFAIMGGLSWGEATAHCRKLPFIERVACMFGAE